MIEEKELKDCITKLGTIYAFHKKRNGNEDARLVRFTLDIGAILQRELSILEEWKRKKGRDINLLQDNMQLVRENNRLVELLEVKQKEHDKTINTLNNKIEVVNALLSELKKIVSK